VGGVGGEISSSRKFGHIFGIFSSVRIVKNNVFL